MIRIEQWLELHAVCLDTVRGAIRGLPAAGFGVQQGAHDDSIGLQINHVIGAEAYWLREVAIEPRFGALDPQHWSERAFMGELARIERQYDCILAERAAEPNVLFGLGRVCQHAIYHSVRICALREALQSVWEPAPPLRWERAADYITDLLIAGPDARTRDY